jgi:multiple sugar transport system substrate-binding protein
LITSERKHCRVFFPVQGLAAVLFFSVLILMLIACDDDTSPVGRKHVLQLWIMPNSLDPAADMEQILRNFELENPGIEVDVTVLDWSVAWTKITTAASTFNGPDIVQMPTTWAASVTQMGALLSLDSLVHLAGGDSLFVPSAMRIARPIGCDSVTSMPWFLDVRPLYYRRDVLSHIGVDPKSIVTWNDFRKTLKKIQQAHLVLEGIPVSPIGYPGRHDWNVIHNFAPWIWGAGGDFLDSAATRSAIADSASIAGIMYYLDLVRSGYNSRRNLGKNTSQVSADFDAGRFAFWFDATNKTIYLDSPRFLGGQAKSVTARNYSCMLPPSSPAGKNSWYFAGGSNLSIFKFTKHKRASEILLRYLTTRADVQLAMSRVTGFLPALKITYEYPFFKEDEKRQIFQQMVMHSKSYPAIHYWGEIETEILLRRFGNMFDLITESPSDRWPEKEILAEIHAADREITNYIQRQRGKQIP